ncbi:MAG: hypothetical protein IPP83_07855 [Flavobacteriales bacterium]|nr:hypothetical protein [Flavobacteriales bacterium]
MRTRRERILVCAFALCTIGWAHAQNDGDHPVTDGAGRTYLAPDALVGGAVNPDGFTVGTAPNTNAALVVEGSQMANPTGEVFRTISPASTLTQWRMFRLNPTTPLEIGSLYATAGGNAFHIKQTVNDASLWIRNYSDNGMRLIDDQYFDLNGYNNNWRAGYVAIGDISAMSPSPPMPWARLHLVHGAGSTSFGWRPWMVNGILFNGNQDQMYIGQKFGSTDVSHAVIQWSEDGTLNNTRQTLRFIYTTTPGSGTGATTLDGLEIMRLWPESNTSGYVGIGDFATASQVPLDRLDVLDGNVRIRALALQTADTRVVVADANGVLHYRPASDFGASDCEWTMPTGGAAGTNHVSTAYGAATTDCPDAAEAVGIGVDLAVDPPDTIFEQLTQ